MKLANAPASWGVFYPDGNRVTPQAYLEALAASGYEQTELGPFGWMPTEASALADLLEAHGLCLCGAAHVHTLADPGSERHLHDRLGGIAALIAPLGVRHIVLMDESEFYPKQAMGAIDDEGFEKAMGMVARASHYVREQFGLQLHFHPHVGTMVEREDQIERMLDRIDISLCLDTGHHAFWGQDPLAFMQKVRNRIGYMHLKNVDPVLRQRVLSHSLGIDSAFEMGVMSPLAQGALDIGAVVRKLRDWDFKGPVVVEQDPSLDNDPTPEALALQNRQFLSACLEEMR